MNYNKLVPKMRILIDVCPRVQKAMAANRKERQSFADATAERHKLIQVWLRTCSACVYSQCMQRRHQNTFFTLDSLRNMAKEPFRVGFAPHHTMLRDDQRFPNIGSYMWTHLTGLEKLLVRVF